MSSGERQVQEQQMLKLAMDEIRAFAAKHNGPAIPKTAAITDYDVRAFDLEYSSSPTMVLTAKLPITPAKGQPLTNFTYFVTIVARVDINDQAKKIFSMVSDSHHLDAYPRMELIDAIDADANGRGDLLFRQYSDKASATGCIVYHPTRLRRSSRADHRSERTTYLDLRRLPIIGAQRASIYNLIASCESPPSLPCSCCSARAPLPRAIR